MVSFAGGGHMIPKWAAFEKLHGAAGFRCDAGLSLKRFGEKVWGKGLGVDTTLRMLAMLLFVLCAGT
jgi:hypothetical protein